MKKPNLKNKSKKWVVKLMNIKKTKVQFKDNLVLCKKNWIRKIKNFKKLKIKKKIINQKPKIMNLNKIKQKSK